MTRDREEIDLALKKYLDMNRLALQAVAPGGMFLTCSCTGLVSEETFLETLRRAAWQAGRTVQVFKVAGRAGTTRSWPTSRRAATSRRCSVGSNSGVASPSRVSIGLTRLSLRRLAEWLAEWGWWPQVLTGRQLAGNRHRLSANLRARQGVVKSPVSPPLPQIASGQRDRRLLYLGATASAGPVGLAWR